MRCCSLFVACALLALATTAVQAHAVAAVPRRAPKHHELTASYSFEQFIHDFSKPHCPKKDPIGYAERKGLFDAELHAVLVHNADTTQTYKKGINTYTDWTTDEKRRLRGHKQSLKQRSVTLREANRRKTGTHKQLTRAQQILRNGAQLPRFVDYRLSVPSILTAVKDQGQCGSCWAHAATESIESYYALSTGKLYTLSQQQISSCTPNPDQCGGTGGCNGAIAELAFDYITFAGGITSEWMYPYQSYWGTNFNCTSPSAQHIPQVTTTGYADVGHNDHAALEAALASIGPVAVSVDASGWGNYEGGIFSGCNYAANISMDHAVQAVGYGHDFTSGLDYWIVRNSWSPDWGENGFIKLLKTQQGSCGWNVQPQNGDGCKGQTAPEWSCGMCGIAYDGIYPNVASNP